MNYARGFAFNPFNELLEMQPISFPHAKEEDSDYLYKPLPSALHSSCSNPD